MDIEQIIKLAKPQLRLPPEITVILASLPMNTHGGILENKKLVINNRLEGDRLLEAVLHELIHLEQIYTKRLKIDGSTMRWDNNTVTVQPLSTLTYKQYLDLPWELDVQCRLPELIAKVVNAS